MSVYKKLKSSDVVVIPYVANKEWNIGFPSASALVIDSNINAYRGEKLTGSFNPTTDPKGSMGEWSRIVYDQMNHLFYQNFTDNLDTSSLAESIYYESASIQRPTSSYYNYDYNDDIIKNYPTGFEDKIIVLSISKNLYGTSINQNTLFITSSTAKLQDDGNGNIYDTTNNNHVGNIFYSLGLIIVTNQEYSDLLNIPDTTTTTTTTTTTAAPLPQITIINNTSISTYNYTYSIQGITGSIIPGQTYITVFDSNSLSGGELIQFGVLTSSIDLFYDGNFSQTINAGNTFGFSYLGSAHTFAIFDHATTTTTSTTTTTTTAPTTTTTTTTTAPTTTTTTSTTTTTTTAPTTTTSTTTTTTTLAPGTTGYFTLYAQYGYDITAASGNGTGMPNFTSALPIIDSTYSELAITSVSPQTFSVTISTSGGHPPSTKLVLLVNGIGVDCTNVSHGDGTYNLTLGTTVTSTDSIEIAVNSGVC